MSRDTSILVVDDDKINRVLLTSLLQREGHRVETADNGVAALERVRARPIDTILLDVLMPKMDGYEVLAAVKNDNALRHIPVIMITALDEADSAVHCIELGADDYLPKPFDPLLLRARLNAGLARKRLHDLEREYLDQVGHVVRAASALETGEFVASSLDAVANRADALGTLARVFQSMAREVVSRERVLRDEVQRLRIEIDETRAARQVEDITATEYFHSLQRRASTLRLQDD